MTATPTTTLTPTYRVGGRVLVQHRGQTKPGRIDAIHRRSNGTEFVVRTDAHDGRPGGVVNLWTTSDNPMAMRPAPEPTTGGAQR